LSPSVSTVNLSTIRFGSDRLTLGAARHLEPELFDINPGTTPRNWWKTIDTIMEIERKLAVIAFDLRKNTLGMDGFADERKQIYDGLTSLYVRYGIASNETHASEMIRDIERQAIYQAKDIEHLHAGRGGL
jgi:hypothetical protein